MPLNKAKYIVDTINGNRCRVVEISKDERRIKFLRELLELNGYNIVTDTTPEGDYRIGVTDITFNPVIAVYERSLKSKSGAKVTPAYWLQSSDNESEREVNYWLK
jgi:hypothetical protein